MSALFIINRASQRVAAKSSRLDPIAGSHGIELYDIRDFKGLPAKVAQIAKAGITQIFIEGGDGTVQGVLSEFLRQADSFNTLPDFAIIPGGMTNQVAKNIGLKPSLIKAALNGDLPTTPMPLLSIETDDGQTHNGFLFSTGAVPMVTEYTKSKLHKKGIGGSLAVAGGILKGVSGSNGDVLKPTPIKMQSSDIETPIESRHLGTVLTTLPSLIMRLDPFWGTGDAPLRLTYIDEDYSGLYRNLAGLWLGKKNKDRSKHGLQSWNVERVDYDYNGPCVLDGEPLVAPSGKISITASQALNFIQAR